MDPEYHYVRQLFDEYNQYTRKIGPQRRSIPIDGTIITQATIPLLVLIAIAYAN
jgi:hypothetical protein